MNIKIICFIMMSFLLVGCLFLPNTVNSSYVSTNSTQSSSYYIPFDNLYLTYSIKAKKDNLVIPTITLMINYTKITANSSEGYDYQQQMIFKNYLLTFIGETQENATFIENSTTRNIALANTEGSYIYWLIYHVSPYNSSKNAKNWDPFWIYPNDVNTSSYPIYSFNFNLTQRTVLYPSDLSLFNYSRTVLIFNGHQNAYSSYENISSNFGLIYDNYTGVLLKGVLNSTIIRTSAINQYYANFELASTNAFAQFPPYPVPPSSSNNPINIIPAQLRKPNYFLIVIIIALPILLTATRLFRLKEISGGME